MQSAFEALICMVVMMALVWVFFTPTLEAYKRRHRQRNVIFHVNLWLGCTVIGWIIAYIWSQSPDIETHTP